MKDQRPNEPVSLMGELRRRRVLYTAVVYGISAFAVTEIAAFLFEGFGAPEWADSLLVALFVAGFPVAMYLSWAFDISTDGIVRTSPGGWRSRWTTIALAMGLLVVSTGSLFYLIRSVPEPPTVAGTSAAETHYGFEPAEKLENSIAVLPFESLSEDSDDAVFSSGVAEEVLNYLGGYRELNIIARTSSFAFRDSAFTAPQISALLGVEYLLQGSVRRHADQVRVSTQLVDEKGVQLWSRNFDRELKDIFAIQTEIAVAVADAVVPEITARTLEIRSTNLEAFEHFLRGRDLLAQRKGESAIKSLQRSIELDPQFALAYAELAIAMAIFRKDRPGLAEKAVETALSLQPGLLRAMAARGLILQGKDWPASEAILRRVVAQDPNMKDATMWLSNSLRVQGRHEEADELLFRALRLDPLHPILVINATTRLAGLGRDDEAISIARRLIESPETKNYHPYVGLMLLYQARGNLVDAAKVAREWQLRMAEIDTLDDPCYCAMVVAHSDLGDRTLADYWLERSNREFPGSWSTLQFNYRALLYQGRYFDALGSANVYFSRRYAKAESLPVMALMSLGVLEALAGDHSSAIERLASLPSAKMFALEQDGFYAVQALAWAYLQTGQAERAEPLLAKFELKFDSLEELGTLYHQLDELPYAYALNAALRGENEEALGRLEAIIEHGWRSVYTFDHDPRWGSLRNHPRYQSLMARVREDVDRQRAELESTAPHQAFVTRLDAIIAEGGERPE